MSLPVLSIPAGRCTRRSPQENWVDAQPDRGVLQLRTRDDLVHVAWTNQWTGTVETELLVFPGEATFSKVDEDPSGRTHVLKFSSSDQLYFFWYIEAVGGIDEQVTVDINGLLQDVNYSVVSATTREIQNEASWPPTPGAPKLSNPVPRPATNSLEPIVPTDSGSGSGSGSAGGSSGEGGDGAGAGESSVSGMARLLSEWVSKGGIPKANEDVRLADLFSPTILSELLSSESSRAEVTRRITPHLPVSIRDSGTPLAQILTAPQFTDAIASLDHALRSGGLPGGMMKDLGLPESAGSSVSSFLEGLKGLKKDGGGDVNMEEVESWLWRPTCDVPVGDISAAAAKSEPIFIHTAKQLEDTRSGQLIAPLGDYLMEWDEECLPPSKLEPPGQDGLQILLHHLEKPEDQQATCVQAFWKEISQPPPGPISAFPTSSEAASRIRLDQIAPTVANGQAVFWRYSAPIFSALLHYSLAAGFSAVRVVNVLRETNYLTGNAKDATYRRLLETTQAILDYMKDLTPVTGIGWKSAVRVRMLHSTVRVRILDRKGIKNVYDEKVDGIPINQEDLLATLGSFAIAPLWSLRRVGIYLTDAEEEAYLAVWRHIGYYLGIKPSRLAHYYVGPRCVSRASKVFACMTMHLFDEDPVAMDYQSTSTYRLLSSVSDRPPRHTPIAYHLATSRSLLGDGLADRLSLPTTSRAMRWRLRRAKWLDKALVDFGKYYWRRSWEDERVDCTRILVSMIVCWQLGVRRTKFTIKTFGGDLVMPMVEGVNDTADVGKRDADAKEKVPDPDDDELDPSILMGPVAGKRIVRRWSWLLAEMAVVLATPGIALTFGIWRYRSLLWW
ncbi:hypothetical protein P7C73_g1904, partial [Tremellales sp. Uapishka_1]